ncbi:cyclic di-GMP phosphodiesterase response regulator RpfG [bacterium BMS3Abin13]|nr:cyclic di-GMP phosphodiesterase response regulator RpfG [bacterium BMS3Abin13]
MKQTQPPAGAVRPKNEPPLPQQFLQALHVLLSSARLYRDNNRLLVASVQQFIATIKRLTREEAEVTLLCTAGGFYLQQDKLVYRRDAAGLVQTMLLFFDRRDLSGLRFYPAVADAPLSHITTFARLLDRAEEHEDPRAWLMAQLKKHHFSWVKHVNVRGLSLEETLATAESASGDRAGQKNAPKAEVKPDAPAERDISAVEAQRRQRKKDAIKTYIYAMLSLQEVAHKVSLNRQASINKPLRMVQNMIDMVVDDSNIFIGLSTIRDYDDYTFTHSINVAILSICLGFRIGLAKSSLEILGLSALFHDLGKIDIPKEILNKPWRLTDNEFELMKRHSLNSVRRIVRLKASVDLKAKILLPPFEHHLKYDLSGYPKTPRKKPISLMGRIITIADVFDAITATRVYRPVALSPDRALGFMLAGSGKDFDPLLLKVFINMIGVYPVGTLLRLDHDEIGLVARYSGESEKNKELVVQLLKADGRGGFQKDREINLGQWNPVSGTFNRPIVESLHPAAYGIQPAEFLLNP